MAVHPWSVVGAGRVVGTRDPGGCQGGWCWRERWRGSVSSDQPCSPWCSVNGHGGISMIYHSKGVWSEMIVKRADIPSTLALFFFQRRLVVGGSCNYIYLCESFVVAIWLLFLTYTFTFFVAICYIYIPRIWWNTPWILLNCLLFSFLRSQGFTALSIRGKKTQPSRIYGSALCNHVLKGKGVLVYRPHILGCYSDQARVL